MNSTCNINKSEKSLLLKLINVLIILLPNEALNPLEKLTGFNLNYVEILLN